MRSEEDLEEYEKRMEAERKRYEELAKLKQSSVVRRALPRPLIINQKLFKQLEEEALKTESYMGES